MSIFFTIVISLVILQFSETTCKVVNKSVDVTEQRIGLLKKFAESLKSGLSSEIDPCEDFYEHVCARTNVSREFKLNVDKIEEIVGKYLQENEKLTNAEFKLKKFLNSCKQRSVEEMKQFVKNFNFSYSTGGWPAFSPDWNEEKFDVQSALAELDSYNMPIIVFKSFDFDSGSFKRYMTVEPRDIFILKSSMPAIKKKMKFFGIDNIDEIINDGIQFEKDYEENVPFDNTGEQPILKTDFAGLKKEIQEINWDKHIEIAIGKKIKDNYPVVIRRSDSLKKSFETILKMKPKIVANYFFCNFILYLPSVEEDDFSKKCAFNAYNAFHYASSGIILKQFHNDNTKTTMAGLIGSVLENLFKYLPVYQHPLTENIAANFSKILKEEYLHTFDEDSLNKEYHDVLISNTNYLQNTISMNRFTKRQFLRPYTDEHLEKLELIKHKLSPIFPLHLYRLKEEPLPLVYTDLALELIMIYSEMLVDINLINPEIRECFSHQHGLLDIDNGVLMGSLSLQILVKAYFDWAKQNEGILQANDKVLREYDLTSKKLLLIGIMQCGCNRNVPDIRSKMLPYFWNLNEFSGTFQCPVESSMSPTEKCEIQPVRNLR